MPLDYAEKYDIAAEASDNILGTTKNFIVSTAADVVSTLYNSLPFVPEAKTEDILDHVDKDALAFYKENTDTVRTASLIGGAFIPGGVALKLLGRARAGVSSVGYVENGILGVAKGTITGQRQKYLALEIEKTFAESGAATSQYKNLVRQLYASNIGQATIDNAIIEAAVVGAMNAHPYMEDYLKDPVTNFALYGLVGGGVFSLFTIPSTRRLLTDLKSPIMEQAIEHIRTEKGYQPIAKKDHSLTASATVQRISSNLRILSDIILDQGEKGLTREIADSIRKTDAAQMEEVILRAAPAIIGPKKAINKEMRDTVLEILSNPEFIGIDKIRFYDLSKVTTATAKKAMIWKDADDLIHQIAVESGFRGQDIEAIKKTFLTEDGKPAIAFIRPSTGELFAPAGVRNVGWAVDVKNASSIIKASASGQNRLVISQPVKDFAEENLLRGKSSAMVDLDYLIELKRFDGLKETEIPYVTIAPDHLPRQNAFLSYLSKLSSEEQAKTKVFIRSDYPTYQAQQQFLEKAVRPNHIANITNLVESSKLDFRSQGISANATRLLDDWIHGKISMSVDIGIAKVRAAFSAFLHKTETSTPENIVAAKEIWNAGTPFREAMRKEADPDGFVYLYRGTTARAISAASVQSYTPKINVAKGFGPSASLYRVHVDNIIGTVGSGGLREAEILVSSPHPQIVNNIPIETAASRAVQIPTPETAQKFTVNEFFKYYADETERQVKNLLASKIMSIEEISSRLNVTTDGVQAVILGAKLSEYPAEWRRYTNAADIDSKYLNLKNKLFAAIGNPSKNPNAEALANLDNRNLRIAHNEIVNQMTQLSNSRIAGQLAEVFQEKDFQLALDSLTNNLAEINIVKVGAAQNALIPQSADQIVRNLKDGSLLTFTGKRVIDTSDKVKRQLLEPLASVFVPFKDKPELFAEFNTAINRLRGSQGWRDIRVDKDTGYGFIVQKQGIGKQIAEVPIKNKDGSIFYIKQQGVLDALEGMREPASEILKLHNLVRRITGMPPVHDLGFYVPPLPIANKALAFVIDNSGLQDVRLLTANNQTELETLINSYKKVNSNDIASGKLSVVKEGEIADFNLAKQYTNYESQITYADISQFHTGSSALAIIPSDARFVNEIMQGFEQQILNGTRRYAETSLSDTMAWLDKLSAYYQGGTEGSPQRGIFKQSVRDPALAVKNILLGRDQLESSVPLKAINSLTEMLYNRAANAVNATAKAFSYEKIGSKEFFENLNINLKSKGIDSPWQSFDEYLATTVAESGNIAPRIQSTGNGMLATMNLRVFELAQAAINIMSLPILTWSSLMEKLPGTTFNPKGDMIKMPLEAMYDGMRFMYSDAGKEMIKKWEQAGHIKQAVRQYTELTASLKAASQGREFTDKALDALDKVQNSKIVKDYFSKPADWAEEWTRTYVMSTGYLAAKKAYPGIGDTAATIAAVAFTDRSVGNYYAHQRPVLFQGTFGAAIGLYQTYVLTYAQSIYRSLENKNFKQLASLALAQSGIFGMASWPGYHMLSEQVVGSMSDHHIDLTTGTYRALDDQAARLILYGLPSSIGPAFYTRGDISPRIPSTMGEIAIFNGMKQGFSAAHSIISKTGEGITTGNATQSMFEALSLQSMNRPIARWAELVSGSSITQEYNTMSPSSEVWTPLGVFARLLGTRPLEEQVVRNAQYLNRFYESLDHDRRAKAVDALSTAIRNNTLNGEILSQTASDYLRFGGTSKGFRSALNEVMLKSEEGTRANMMRKLEPDSPLRQMIDNLY